MREDVEGLKREGRNYVPFYCRIHANRNIVHERERARVRVSWFLHTAVYTIRDNRGIEDVICIVI